MLSYLEPSTHTPSPDRMHVWAARRTCRRHAPYSSDPVHLRTTALGASPAAPVPTALPPKRRPRAPRPRPTTPKLQCHPFLHQHTLPCESQPCRTIYIYHDLFGDFMGGDGGHARNCSPRVVPAPDDPQTPTACRPVLGHPALRIPAPYDEIYFTPSSVISWVETAEMHRIAPRDRSSPPPVQRSRTRPRPCVRVRSLPRADVCVEVGCRRLGGDRPGAGDVSGPRAPPPLCGASRTRRVSP